MFPTALLATLSWAGFITAGFVLWANGNTNGGYSMVGISIILPAVVAVAVHITRALSAKPTSTGWTPNLVATTLLGSLSWLGFIVCGFVLWFYGNTNGGYSMVGIGIILPAVLAVPLYVLACRQPADAGITPLTFGVALLGSMSWLGFLVAGFMLWYYGNTNGGYSMVSIAIILPAVVAAIYQMVMVARAPVAAPMSASTPVVAAAIADAPAAVATSVPASSVNAGVVV